MDFTALLEELNIDKDETLDRFGQMAHILERFLLKFPEDPTMELLEKALADDHELERTAHTLKGLAANLGLNELSLRAAACVNHIREGHPDMAREDILPIRQEYTRVTELIRQYRTNESCERTENS